jgi:hypothetical protein
MACGATAIASDPVWAQCEFIGSATCGEPKFGYETAAR